MMIGGEIVPGSRTMESVNPYTGELWAEIPDATPDEVGRAVTRAQEAFDEGSWSQAPGVTRAAALHRLAEFVEERVDEFAAIETRETGKLLKETRAQIVAVARWYRFYAGLADKIEGSVVNNDIPGVFTYTLREPLGVIACIAPWNSPLMLATWQMAPALAAGNTVVAKPSENTSASLLELAPLFQQAGFPDGVVNVVSGRGAECGDALVRDPQIAKVAFTGGAETARRILSSLAGGLKPALLELGGKSANIVFGDANLDAAESGVLAGIFAASGQTCIAGSRVLLERSIADEMLERLERRAGSIVLGDPMASGTQMGPMATSAQRDTVSRFVTEATDEGAQLITGGEDAVPAGTGFFFAPTILGNVRPDMRVAQEEVFGPVLVAMMFDGEDEAIALANGTDYALGAGIWTLDVKRAHRVAARVSAGAVYVNMYRSASPAVPFGGSRRSGFGRLNGVAAVNEFTTTKSVWLDLGEEVQDPFMMRS